MPYAELRRARIIVESLMDHECTITHNNEGWVDSVLNTTSGTIVPPDDPEEETVYEGKCNVWHKSSPLTTVNEAGAIFVPRIYMASVPKDTDTIVEGDLFTVTASAREPGMVGLVFKVMEVIHGTYFTGRWLRLELR